MPNPGEGHTYPPQPVSWTKRDLLLFASSIGVSPSSLHLLYELHPTFAAFPTYPIILPFKGTSSDVVDFYATQSSNRSSIPGVPALDSRRVVDGERTIEFLKPLPTSSSSGGTFEIHSRILGVYDKGPPGTVVETEQVLLNTATNEIYTRAIGKGFFVGQGNWGGPKGPKTENYPPPQGREADARYEFQTNEGTALLYRLNGDYNPLHATPEPGRKMGFGGAIVHGLFSWNCACVGVLSELGGDEPGNIRMFSARFASPVRPGDKLVTEMWRMGDKDADGFEEIRFVTKVEGGKVCLSNGRARVKIVGKKTQSKL
ncbi:hypothetical protein MBLNU457_6035t1 [Dothideomycetes sp. NU457]